MKVNVEINQVSCVFPEHVVLRWQINDDVIARRGLPWSVRVSPPRRPARDRPARCPREERRPHALHPAGPADVPSATAGRAREAGQAGVTRGTGASWEA